MKRSSNPHINFQIEKLKFDIAAFQRELRKDLYLLLMFQSLTIISVVCFGLMFIFASSSDLDQKSLAIVGFVSIISFLVGGVCWIEKYQNMQLKKKLFRQKRNE